MAPDANNKLPKGLSVGAPVSGGKKKKRALPKGLSVGAPVGGGVLGAVAPSVGRSISRPAPALRDAYGLVFDDVAASSFEGKTEQEALGELYRQRTGKELSSQKDVRKALEDAQIIRKAAAPKRASDLGEDDGIFASALDLLDAINTSPLARGRRDRKRDALDEKADAAWQSTKGAIGGAFRKAGEAVADVAQTRVDVPGVKDDPTVLGLAALPVKGLAAANEAAGKIPEPYINISRDGVDVEMGTIAENQAKVDKQVGGVARRWLGVPEDAPVKNIGDFPAGPQFRVGGRFTKEQKAKSSWVVDSPVGGVRMEPGKTLRDEALGTGADPIRVSDEQAQAVSDALFALQSDEDRLVKLATAAQLSFDGGAASDTQAAMSSMGLGPLNKRERNILLTYARKLGWDIADGSEYSDAELLRRAYTNPGEDGKANTVAEVRRGLLRQFGQFSSLPAGFLMIGKEIASGDPNRIEGVVREALQPYGYVLDDAEKRGWGPALASFAQERPVDAALIFSSLVRGAGRSVGVAARTFGGTGSSIPQLLINSRWAPRRAGALTATGEAVVPSRLDRFRTTVGDFAATDRPVTIKTGNVRSPDDEISGEAIIGYTTPNLLSTSWLAAKRALANAEIRATGKLSRPTSMLVLRRTRRAIRRIEDRKDDAAARASMAVEEVMFGLTRPQQLRLALELVSAQVLPTQLGGGKYRFESRAQMWRDRAGVARQNADLVRAGEAVDANGKKLRSNANQYLADALLFERQARFFDEIAKTEVPAERVAAAREALRDLGDDNDTLIALMIEQLGLMDDARGFERALARPQELRVGDRFDVGAGGEVVPARVKAVQVLPDGRVRVERMNIVDPTDVRVVEFDASQRVVLLRPGVNSVKYLRQFLEWEEAMTALAEEIVAARNALTKADLAPYNAAVRRLETLLKQRDGLYERVNALLVKMEDARASGSLSKSRSLRKQYEREVTKLVRKLREMEQVALRIADEARKVDKNDPLVGRMTTFAEELRAARREVVKSRGIEGRAPFSAKGELVDVLPDDPLANQQARVLRTLDEGEVPPLRTVRQPEAVARLERAQGLRERATTLEELRARLDEERAGAPTAAQAGAARRELPIVGEDVARLVDQSAVVRQSAGADFTGVLDDLIERLLYVESRRPWPAEVRWARNRASKARRTFLRSTMADRAEARRVLQELDQKVQDGRAITGEDIASLEAAERLVVGVEARTKRYKNFALLRAPKSFGKRRVASEVVSPRAKAQGVLGEARGREARADELIARLRARDAAPSAADVRRVDKMIKDLRKQADKSQREAQKIIARGTPLVTMRNVKAVLDASSNRIAIEVEGRKPVRFTLPQVMGELKQEYIARAEMTGDDPVLWLGTRRASFGLSPRNVRYSRRFDIGPAGGVPSGRLMVNTGKVIDAGLETQFNAVMNLINDTGVIRGALEWQRQMRKFIETISLRIDDVSEGEAYKLNETLASLMPEDQRSAFMKRVRDEFGDVAISEAESVVWDARQYVAIDAFEGRVVGRDRVFTGAIDDVADEDLSALFAREAKATDIAKAGGSYYLIPRFLYDEIQRELESINYRPGSKTKKADFLTRQWRMFTLNIIPRTGFANLLGSAALAMLAGAGPKSFYLAYRHLKYGDVPAPVELRQRYGMTLTNRAEFQWLRENQAWLDSPLGALAWWMNNMRRFNGVSEDFGRLAVWYSKAYPEARRLAGEDFTASWRQMRSVTDRAEDVLRAFANNDPDFEQMSARFVDTAFEWIGDLHQGGALNTQLRVAIPFQQWYRHILRLMLVTMPLKYPGRSLFLQQVADIGSEYVKQHGFLAAWVADMLPIWEEEKTVLGEQQKYVLGWRTSAWNPLQTGAEIVTGDELDVVDYGAGALTPIWKNIFLLSWSVLNGEMQTFGGDSLTRPMLNEYGNTIELMSKMGGQTALNMGIQSLPLSSTAMSSMGQTAEGNVLWGGSQRLLRGDEGVLPGEALPPEPPGKDVAQVVGDVKDVVTGSVPLSEFKYENFVALTVRLLLGGSASYQIAKGPVQTAQFKAMMGASEAQFVSSINNTLKKLEDERLRALGRGDTREAERIRREQAPLLALKNR